MAAAIVENTPPCISISPLQLQVQIGNNSPQTVCSPTQPDGYCSSAGDPCLLSGGSDLPGTVLKASLVQQNGQGVATDTYVFQPDTAAPTVTLTTTPSNGVKVKAGDTIELTGIAEEIKDAGWQTGVQKIEVWQTAPTAEQEGVETFNSYANKSCGAKSWKQTTQTFTYPVPKNPPAAITFCAYAWDFAGNQAKSKCATFYTGLFTIMGSLELHSDQTLSSHGIVQHDKQDLVTKFTAAGQPDGTMTGTAQSTFSETNSTAEPGCTDTWKSGDLSWSAILSGTFQKNSDGSLLVNLNLTPNTSPPYFTGYCGKQGGPITAGLPRVTGKLVNGKYDFRQDYPLSGSGTSGYGYLTIHIEMVPNP
jgi:hypothetical protein